MFQKRGEKRQLSEKSIFWMGVATLLGTIIGAGILGIPYVVAKAGVLYGFFLMLVLGVAFVFLNLFAGEMVLRTKEQHQLTGYAEKYLGKPGRLFMTLSMLISIYGALTAYLIGEGAALHAIIKAGAPLLFTLIFFVVGVAIVIKGIRATGRAELFLILLLLGVIVLIGILSLPSIQQSNFSVANIPFLFLPYGVILFAFMGSPAIPVVQEVLGEKKKLMKKVIITASIIPIFLYILFTFFVVGTVGLANFELLEPNQRIATIALQLYTHPLLGLFANLLAVLSMFTSFLTLSTALVEVYQYDYRFSRTVALLLTFSLPLLMVLFKLTTFIAVLGVTGALAGGMDGILITLMYWKAKVLGDRQPEYSLRKHYVLGGFLILLFSLGIVYQIVTRFLG